MLRHSIRRCLRHFAADDSGPTVAEYAMMLGLVLAVMVFLVSDFGNHAADWWQTGADALGRACALSR